MADLIAKIKKEYKNVLSQNNNIIDNLDLSTVDAIDYTSTHKLNEDEWFRINNFSTTDYYINECDNSHSTASISQISNNEYKKIEALGIIQGDQKHFQRVTSSFYVNKRTILDYSGQPSIVKQRKQIVIRKESDAIYFSNSDILYFKDIGKIKPIFSGIGELHREATQSEVDSFMAYSFISLDQDKYSSESVGTLNRKRIADVGQKYNSLSDENKRRLEEYSREKAGIDIDDSGNFLISSDKDLKKLLYAMEQRYYRADIYGEDRVATAYRPSSI